MTPPYTDSAWWPIACAATEAGMDVVVIDPTAEEGDVLWSEDPRHGAVTVVPAQATGWSLHVSEPEQRVSG